jgi:hypothetical protein
VKKIKIKINAKFWCHSQFSPKHKNIHQVLMEGAMFKNHKKVKMDAEKVISISILGQFMNLHRTNNVSNICVLLHDHD